MNPALHIILFFFFLACVAGLGRCALAMTSPGRAGQPAQWLPPAFLLGAGSLSIIMLPLSMTGLKTALWMPAITGIIMLAGALISRRPPETPSAGTPWSKYEYNIFLIFALLLAANFVLVSLYPQFDIDMVGHILMKGKAAAHSAYTSEPYFNDSMFAITHNNYPPLTVFLQSVMFLLGLDSIADWHALNYTVLLLTTLALHAALRRRIGTWPSLVWAFILISTAEYLKNQLLISSTDMIFALAVLLCAIAWLDAINQNNGEGDNLFSALCGTLILIKNEGLLLACLFTLALWIRRRRFPGRHLTLLVMITGPWIMYRMTLPDPSAATTFVLRHLTEQLKPENLLAFLDTVVYVLTRHLNIIFIISLFTWPLAWRNKDLRTLMVISAVTALAYVLFIWLAFSVGTGNEAPGLMRFWSQLYPLMLFITALALNTKPSAPSNT